MNLGQLPTPALVQTLAHPNIWQRRMAQRLLNERHDPLARQPLDRLARSGQTVESRLAALWTFYGSGLLNDALLDDLAADPEPAIRTWVARLSGERHDASPKVLARLLALASDKDPSVRVGVATAVRQFTSGSLTVDTPVPSNLAGVDVIPILGTLLSQPNTDTDPLLPFMIWTAAEPVVARDPQAVLAWLTQHGGTAFPASGNFAGRVLRRLCDTQKPEALDQALAFVTGLTPEDAPLAGAALEGLIQGLKERVYLPKSPIAPFLSHLDRSADPQVRRYAGQLGSLWGDAAETTKTLAGIRDPQTPLEQRLQYIRAAHRMRSPEARETLLALLSPGAPEPLVLETLAALGEVGGDGSVANSVVSRYGGFTPAARRAALEMLASRTSWARVFLGAVEAKTIAALDVPIPVIRELSKSKDQSIRDRAVKSLGRYREPNADKAKIIAQKKQIVLHGDYDLEAGHQIAKKTCFICHKLHGEGAEVGPDLTGVGRSTLDALLANVIDPNQFIGKGYENVEVETKDGRSLSGRLVEDTDTHIKLLSAGPREEVVSRNDLSSLKVSATSVMPEGLEQMPEADFRNLMWYILNPPQDGRKMTPELYRQLVGEQERVAPAP
jgi:putative heme-binding domain-containing protein